MGKKDDAFVLKERGVVTTTIQGGSYNPGRLIYEDDHIEIYTADYNSVVLNILNSTSYSPDSFEIIHKVLLKANSIYISTIIDSARSVFPCSVGIDPDTNNILINGMFRLKSISTVLRVSDETITSTVYTITGE